MSTAKTLKRISLGAITLGCALLLYSMLLSPTQSGAIPLISSRPAAFKPVQAVVSLPVSLYIPKINVTAPLDYVGITAAQQLGVPSGPAKAGWYDQGPRPGEVGSAVIDGHFGYRDNIPAVFDNLHNLLPGDDIYVTDQKGLTATFVVREIRTYEQDQDASDIFHSSDGKAHLNLITCQGAWSAAQKSYPNRLVVFADKVIWIPSL